MCAGAPCHDVIKGIRLATEAERCAPNDEPQEVRCFSSTALSGYKKKSCHGKELWTEADSAGFGGCQHNLTWAAADTLCISMGARLCTCAEVSGGCTGDTGCGHNKDLVWTSTSTPSLGALCILLALPNTPTRVLVPLPPFRMSSN